ncbi:MAG: L,D-transpeptidase [Streptosporangiaceae bacterium]|nr:L,D-transpeptidase [Streptosporangiaceae bacterium]MBV9857356.1 L,D-transpeptidase [Streptosporangiaceae bacterium]
MVRGSSLSAAHGRGRRARGRRRAAAWLIPLAVAGVAVTAAVLWRDRAPSGVLPLPVAGSSGGRVAAINWPAAQQFAASAEGRPVLTRQARGSCPRAATACVDLTGHLTWLQSEGRITYGPVRMEPGPPGTPHATPRGTFYVEWKAGPGYVSNIYFEPMPYAVFFAAGGVAFHGGSLTHPSHGCVHLTIGNARYYNEHLQVGAEVVVF